MVPFEEFKKLSIKIARIKEVKDHPNADKLYILTIEAGGEEKTLIAGLKKAYKPEELQGKLVTIVDNLQPAVIRGVESNGMVLAAQDGEKFAVIVPDKEVRTGAIVK